MKWRINLISSSNNHEPILLNHNKLITLGRDRVTKITDAKVSRKQVELVADCDSEDGHISVSLIGKFAQLNDEVLQKNRKYIMKSGDVLSLKKNEFKYELKVETASGDTDDESGGVVSEPNESCINKGKRKSTVKSSSSASKKKIKINTEVDDHRHKKNDNEDNSDDSHNDDSDNKKNDDDEAREIANKERLTRLKNKFKDDDSPNDNNTVGTNITISSTTVTNTKADMASNLTSCSSKNDENYVKPPLVNAFWEEVDDGHLFVYHSKGLVSREKIAGFDLDDTVITTKSGKVYPEDMLDWKFLFHDVPKKLKNLHQDGYKIALFSNQLGIKRGKIEAKDFKEKLEKVVNQLGVPVQAYIATGTGLYRKPCYGMWKRLIDSNDGIEINLADSFFVGDAAGRPKDWLPKKKKDFSCSDRLFSMNNGLKFQTPEEYFLGQKPAKFSLPEFNPQKLDENASLFVEKDVKLPANGDPEIIVMVGYPASGKSYFVKKHLVPLGYQRVNRDTLGTWQKCVKKCEDALTMKQKVVVDNTNPDIESREKYLKVAKEMNVRCRCFIMMSSFEHSKHNERFREMTDKQHQQINEMVFNSFKSKFKEPDLSEGFDEIVHVNFVPKFETEKERSLYNQYLLEK